MTSPDQAGRREPRLPGVTGDELRNIEFREAFRGYHPRQVDRFLDGIAAAFDQGQPIADLLRSAQFDRALRGYRPEDVDQLVERLRLET